ncbi:MAG: hypothetical protein A3A80_04220 [Candidatus Terrybacteria bacterium RIFCSPLOWO2_01_FULL_44_24]|uniref:HD domain-containing protein n=1 Tax=Candidatus Terrybacteria bacterium RIFCSPHIGHO2_01_FULL_43_35 TaxID=1802361 RepID=A0A1G2PFD2_9BACT|nr:MAG: hypothetical protein A2828_01095 [Candidatus Terrybacteria bacterium RIFCSPHIGHO2_01_FULL_43_35]OHA51841.1 MAG: hypothetical protein A3A80_04220 [Candidatus Terrybacteria bacterium RIFCSPLOWO2_01_FULL_44_24]
MELNKVRAILADEVISWERVQRLKSTDIEALIKQEPSLTLAEALQKSQIFLQQGLEALDAVGFSFEQADSGHGLGHFTRDYAHAMRLIRGLNIPPQELLTGLLGGIFHDIGCAMVRRYDEPRRIARHAEAGAILLEELFQETSLGLSKVEQDLVAYGVAAHTHYLKSMDVVSAEGITRKLEPYVDTINDKPILAVWLPRWVDRLDVNGAGFVGRHYLTLVEQHEDFSGSEQRFYTVNFEDHLRPLLRTPEEIKAADGNRTMREHLALFASSQNNQSPYGKHDLDLMVVMRDKQTARLQRIIGSITPTDPLHPAVENEIVDLWTIFLACNVEPTRRGRETAETLAARFRELPEDTQHAWCKGFLATMQEYIGWAEETMSTLNKLSPAERRLGNIVEDITEIVAPNQLWATTISSMR